MIRIWRLRGGVRGGVVVCCSGDGPDLLIDGAGALLNISGGLWWSRRGLWWPRERLVQDRGRLRQSYEWWWHRPRWCGGHRPRQTSRQRGQDRKHVPQPVPLTICYIGS